VGYRHLQRVEVVGDKSDFDDDDPEILRGVIEEAAAGHAELVDGDTAENGDLVATAAFDNDLSVRYPGKEVEVVDVENAFVFHVETDGSFSADDLVVQAIDTIEDRAADLREAVQL
jgi:DNA-directed RNA polymerase subunit D